MENITIEEIINAVRGELIKDSKNNNFSGVYIDSRKVKKDGIFFGLQGEKANGSKFSSLASDNGASLAIIDEIPEDISSLKPYTSVIKVSDSREALKNLASFYRSSLKIKVIGITGSNGKTSTKDITAAVLSNKYKVFKTEGNFNNDIGLPLMIFQIDNSYDIAVLEMGMSNLGEIHTLAGIARPDIGIITNIGSSHLENLKTRENILKAKMEITDYFSCDNVLIINGDNDLLKEIKKENFKILRAGSDSVNNTSCRNINLLENGVSFDVYEDGEYKDNIFVNALGKHSAANSILAVACARKIGLSFNEIKEGLRNLNKTKMRLEVIEKSNYRIINDCYNASPDSMKAAIDVMKAFNGRKIAVFGTMLELGENSPALHREVGRYAKDNGVFMLLTAGDFKEEYEKGFGINSYTFNTKEDLSKFLKYNIQNNDIILIKASRVMKFETIMEELD